MNPKRASGAFQGPPQNRFSKCSLPGAPARGKSVASRRQLSSHLPPNASALGKEVGEAVAVQRQVSQRHQGNLVATSPMSHCPWTPRLPRCNCIITVALTSKYVNRLLSEAHRPWALISGKGTARNRSSVAQPERGECGVNRSASTPAAAQAFARRRAYCA